MNDPIMENKPIIKCNASRTNTEIELHGTAQNITIATLNIINSIYRGMKANGQEVNFRLALIMELLNPESEVWNVSKNPVKESSIISKIKSMFRADEEEEDADNE